MAKGGLRERHLRAAEVPPQWPRAHPHTPVCEIASWPDLECRLETNHTHWKDGNDTLAEGYLLYKTIIAVIHIIVIQVAPIYMSIAPHPHPTFPT